MRISGRSRKPAASSRCWRTRWESSGAPGGGRGARGDDLVDPAFGRGARRDSQPPSSRAPGAPRQESSPPPPSCSAGPSFDPPTSPNLGAFISEALDGRPPSKPVTGVGRIRHPLRCEPSPPDAQTRREILARRLTGSVRVPAAPKVPTIGYAKPEDAVESLKRRYGGRRSRIAARTAQARRVRGDGAWPAKASGDMRVAAANSLRVAPELRPRERRPESRPRGSAAIVGPAPRRSILEAGRVRRAERAEGGPTPRARRQPGLARARRLFRRRRRRTSEAPHCPRKGRREPPRGQPRSPSAPPSSSCRRARRIALRWRTSISRQGNHVRTPSASSKPRPKPRSYGRARRRPIETHREVRTERKPATSGGIRASFSSRSSGRALF